MVSIVTGAIGLLVAVFIIVLMRRDKLHVSHGLGWVMVAVGFAFLGFAPSVIDKVAAYFSVAYPPVLALTLGVSVLVIKILLMDIERSRIEARNQRLIQRIAMLEADLKASSRAKRETAAKNLGKPGENKPQNANSLG
jgi:hypothetical protein